MSRLLDACRDYFAGRGWVAVDDAAGGDALHLRYFGSEAEWGCIAQVVEEMGLVVFYSVAPFVVEEPQRAAVLERIARINWELGIGSFDLDVDGGALRFRTSVDAEHVTDLDTVIGPLVEANLAIMDNHVMELAEVAEALESDES